MPPARRSGWVRVWQVVFGFVLVGVLACGLFLWRTARRRSLDQALIAAVRRMDALAASNLLKRGADPNARDLPEPRQTLWETLRSLVRPARRPSAAADTALMLAVRPVGATDDLIDAPDLPVSLPDNTGVVRALLKAHANPNTQDAHGYTVLMWALRVPRHAILKDLIASGADPNRARRDGLTPLMVAVYMADRDAMAYLLTHGADINARDRENGQTALILAVTLELPGCVQTLLQYHARTDLRDRYGKTAADYALHSSDKTLQRLLAPGQ